MPLSRRNRWAWATDGGDLLAPLHGLFELCERFLGDQLLLGTALVYPAPHQELLQALWSVSDEPPLALLAPAVAQSLGRFPQVGALLPGLEEP